MSHSRIYAMERFVAKPECVEALKETLQRAAARTRQEPGCCRIEAFQDQEDPAKFVVCAVFADRAALEQHRSAGWHGKIAATLPALLAQPREGATGRGREENYPPAAPSKKLWVSCRRRLPPYGTREQ